MPLHDQNLEQSDNSRDEPLPSLGAAYRQAIFDALPPDDWRRTVAHACAEALEGDHQARQWIQKLLGVHDAVTSQAALEERAKKFTHFDLLGEVEAARTRIWEQARRREEAPDALAEDLENGHVQVAPEEHAESPPQCGPGDAYRQAIFDEVRPETWRRIVARAGAEAIEGDHRAREWVLKLLGVDDAVKAQAAIDHSHRFVRIDTFIEDAAAEDTKCRPT